MSTKFNLPILAASISVAIILWVGQSKPDETSRTIDIPLAPIGLNPKTLVITGIDPSIRVSLRGPEEIFSKLAKQKFEAYVDLARSDFGTNRYMVILPKEVVDLAQVKNPYTKVSLDRFVERSIPVEVEGIGSLKDKSQSLGGTLEADPAKVAISGAQSLVEQVAKGVARLNLAELDTTESKPIPLQVILVDRDDNKVLPRGDDSLVVKPPLIYVTPRILSAPTMRTLVVTPRFLGSPKTGYLPDGYSIDPPQVEVRGKSLDVARLTNIETEPIDVTGLDKPKEYSVKLRVPAGLTLVRKTNLVKVRYQVKADVAVAPLKTP